MAAKMAAGKLLRASASRNPASLGDR